MRAVRVALVARISSRKTISYEIFAHWHGPCILFSIIHEGVSPDRESNTMNTDVIQDWTDTQVPLKCGDSRDVRYRILKNGTRVVQEIREFDGTLIHKLELPEGTVMKKISFEASLRHVLTEIADV